MSDNILVVADSPTVRNIIKIYLMNLRLSILEAEDATRALQLLRLVPVSMVIADIELRGTDGITFVKEIRASEAAHLRGIPVILLTAEKGGHLQQRGAEAGANGFLQKPVSHAALTATVRQLLPPAAR
ncbi:response regulator [Sorangium sp. So ce854]|uniref:response regulator n=1 Tax=Sorangium sp. So ce854 TaxID=3133322 RepID=UPI003F5EEA24